MKSETEEFTSPLKQKEENKNLHQKENICKCKRRNGGKRRKKDILKWRGKKGDNKSRWRQKLKISHLHLNRKAKENLAKEGTMWIFKGEWGKQLETKKTTR